MIDYESELFRVAPWVKEVMQVVKKSNNANLMRPRSGWKIRGIKNAESIYEHICKMGLASYYLFGTKDAIAKGVVHDFPEERAPDYIPGEINPELKRKGEFKAMMDLSKTLPDGDFWYNQWVEFENKVGIGKHLFELDKMCPVIQSINYSKDYKDCNLEEFYPYARSKIATPELRTLLDNLYLGRCKTEDAYGAYFNKLKNIHLSLENS